MSLKRNLTLLKFHDKISRKYFLEITLHFSMIFALITKNQLNTPNIISILISIKLMDKIFQVLWFYYNYKGIIFPQVQIYNILNGDWYEISNRILKRKLNILKEALMKKKKIYLSIIIFSLLIVIFYIYFL